MLTMMNDYSILLFIINITLTITWHHHPRSSAAPCAPNGAQQYQRAHGRAGAALGVMA